MRYVHGVQTITKVPFKEKFTLHTFLLYLILLDGHVLHALPTSAEYQSTGTPLAAPNSPSKPSISAPISTIAFMLDRSPADATITVQDQPTLTVNVVDVGIANIGGTAMAEANGTPLSSIFVPPVGSDSTKGNGLDVVFSMGFVSSEVPTSTITFVMTSTMADTAAMPSSTGDETKTSPKSTRKNGHIIFECIALIALSVLMGMLTSRLTAIYPHRHRVLESGEHILRWLALVIPIFGLFFISSTVMLIDVWDDNSASRCHAATLICLVFYVGVKSFEYLFLIERAHQLRSRQSFIHLDDSWFLIEFLALIIGFGPIAFFGFHEPESEISPTDGLCRIGLPPRAAISILVFNVLLSIALGVHFCLLIWKVSSMKSIQHISGYLYAALPFKKLQATSTERQKLLAFRIGRVIWGLVAITIPTFANLFSLAYVHGHEQGWLCFSICTVDITWGIIVIHWLTSEPSYSIPPVPASPGLAIGLRSHFGRPRTG